MFLGKILRSNMKHYFILCMKLYLLNIYLFTLFIIYFDTALIEMVLLWFKLVVLSQGFSQKRDGSTVV